MGVTLRELGGWAPKTFTIAADGAVSVSVTEPRFTRTEVARLIAAQRKAAEPRGDHGWTLAEATDKKNMGRFKLSEPVTDFVMKAEAEGIEAAKKKYGDDMMRYLRFSVEKV